MRGSGSAEDMLPSATTEASVAASIAGYRDRVVAVTGGAGFIAGALRRRLSAAGAEVHAVGRGTPPDAGADRWWQVDLRAPGALDELVAGLQPDVLFHLAGETSAARGIELVAPTFFTNLAATVNTFCSVASHSPTTRVVTAGSLEEPLGTGTQASSPYALSKATVAAYAQLFHELYGTRIVHLRVAMVYGPGQAAREKLVPSVSLALLAGKPAMLSSGRRQVDWVYVDDVAGAFLAAGLSGSAEGRVLDVGSGILVPVRAVAEEIAGIVGGGELRFGAHPDRADEQERPAETEPAASLLQWRATTPLSEGLRNTVDWYRRERG
jgi:UDP-glucose 4-epimerase